MNYRFRDPTRTGAPVRESVNSVVYRSGRGTVISRHDISDVVLTVDCQERESDHDRDREVV